MNQGRRIMRIPLPVSLIREMDAVIIDGIGGYSTRAEFIVDAIHERILELTIEEVPGPRPVPQRTAPGEPRPPETMASRKTPSDANVLVTMGVTELAFRNVGFSILPTDNLNRPEGEALFGLHNRDYPSLWALSRLSEMADEAPISLTDYRARVLRDAWHFGDRLLAIEKRTGRKCTALFPTNPDKRQSAEARFWMFAIGDFRIGADNTIATMGPLFEWHTVGLSGSVDEPRISLTAAGWRLLAALSGLSVEEPHSSTSATAFLAHLREHAPSDWSGFIEILRAIGPDGATRRDVLNHAGTQWPRWTKNMVSTNAAGYIARAREWGLVKPKQSKSRYQLTPFGVEQLRGEKK